MDITRSRLDRILFIDARIRQGGYPNATDMTREWAEHIGSGTPVDRKTIQRDIDYLRDMHRAPIEFSHKENGFHYTESTWKLPFGLQLTEGELLALLLARQMGEMYKDTPVAEYIEGLFGKIRTTLGGAANVDPSLIGEQVSFHNHPARPIDPDVWKQLFTSIRHGRVMEIVYRGLYDSEESVREVEPIHMANVDDDWYMVGFCRKSAALRHFSISRILRAKTTNKTFLPHDDFDPERYFSNRFGKFIAQPDTQSYSVVLRFSRSVADRVLERVWHPRQKMIKEKGGTVRLTMPLPSLIEAKRFCLGWGKEVEVLEPAELRQDILNEARGMVSRHT